MIKLLNKIDNNSILELQFKFKNNKYIDDIQFNTLLNLFTNYNTLFFTIIKYYFDDDNNNIYKEDIYNGYEQNKDNLIYSNYKLIDLIDIYHTNKISTLNLYNETKLTDDIINLYDEDFFNIKEYYINFTHIFILQMGVQGYLISTNKKNINDDSEYYIFKIRFNTNIIKDKYKLEKLITKYIRKFNFYLNIQFILKKIITKLFKLKYINELNTILNKPATLRRNDIPKLVINYTITDKADGERHLLIIDKYNTGYLIDNKFIVKHILKNPIKNIKNCILDGELIKQNGKNNDLFLIFDMLLYNNESIIDKKFIHRMDYINKLNEKKFNNKKYDITSDENKKIHIKIKQFYILDKHIYLMDISDDDKKKLNNYSFLKLLSSDKYTDFMIDLWNNRNKYFEYLLDGLIFTSLNNLYKQKNNMHITYKWKDVHTIDVRVINDKKDDTIWYFDVNRKNDNKYDIIENYTYDEKKDINGTVKFGEYDIVEFMFDDKQNQFIPLRLRNDKNIPNARLTVESVIKAIEDNINIDEIFNMTDIDFGSVFYQEINQKQKYRKKSLDINMREFHNYIKNKLIQYPYINSNNIIGNNNKSLLDVSTGKGGDLMKYWYAKYYNILALDISSNSLEEFNKRIKKFNKPELNITLINADSTKNILSYDAGINDIDKKKLKIYFDQHKDYKFDKIVCNFAISYMFTDDDPYAENFFKNIYELLKNNDGVFVGTLLDGDKLDEYFIKNKKKEIIAKNNGDIFYKIKPLGKYYKKNNNNKILVSRHEWIYPIYEKVIYKYILEKSLAKYNLELIQYKNFKDYYNDFKKDKKKILSNNEQKISFLHYSFIIKKK